MACFTPGESELNWEASVEVTWLYEHSQAGGFSSARIKYTPVYMRSLESSPSHWKLSSTDAVGEGTTFVPPILPYP